MTMCVCTAVLKRSSSRRRVEMAALCSKPCHLKDTDVT
jgi:hypothetical protein